MVNVLILNAGDAQIKAAARALRQSRQKSIRLWIERAYVNEPPYNNWKDKHVIDNRVGALPNVYYEWNINNQTVQNLGHELRSMWWRMKEEQLEFCIMTNMPQPKNRMVMFEDSYTDDRLPNRFESIRCFGDYDSFMNYCKQTGTVQFSLHDTCFFKHEHATPKVKGAEVFREIATDRLWYKDTLHKDHYEVYEPRGRKHIAEANLNGEIDFSKADDQKHPII
mgnify:CR=1 FL=1